MIEFSTSDGEFSKLMMSGTPDDLCTEMAKAIERFTFQLLSAMPSSRDSWSEMSGQIATGFTLAVKEGFREAKEKAE